jgi:hypothetical protein
VGFVVGKVALGQVFSEYFGLPCQFSFHRLLHTHLSSGAGTIGQLVADIPSGLSLTPPQETKKESKLKLLKLGSSGLVLWRYFIRISAGTRVTLTYFVVFIVLPGKFGYIFYFDYFSSVSFHSLFILPFYAM